MYKWTTHFKPVLLNYTHTHTHTHTEGERDRDRWSGGNLLEGIGSSDCGG